MTQHRNPAASAAGRPVLAFIVTFLRVSFLSSLVAAAAFGFVLAITWGALGHDHYTGVHNHLNVNCCNGEDCEPTPVTLVDGGINFYSARYARDVFVATEKITFRALPDATAGAHWCGFKKAVGVTYDAASVGSDPEVATRCAFIDPGGS